MPLHVIPRFFLATLRRCAPLREPIPDNPGIIRGHGAVNHVPDGISAVPCGLVGHLGQEGFQAGWLISLAPLPLIVQPARRDLSQLGGERGQVRLARAITLSLTLSLTLTLSLSFAFFAFVKKHLLFLLFMRNQIKLRLIVGIILFRASARFPSLTSGRRDRFQRGNLLVNLSLNRWPYEPFIPAEYWLLSGRTI